MNKLQREIFEMEQELGVPSHLRWYNTKPKQESNIVRLPTYYEPKQETLKEAAEIICHTHKTPIEQANEIIKLVQERSYSEEEVKELLETQRGNCYVAVLMKTKNDEIASIALTAPEPGGKNGTWIKNFTNK